MHIFQDKQTIFYAPDSYTDYPYCYHVFNKKSSVERYFLDSVDDSKT